MYRKIAWGFLLISVLAIGGYFLSRNNSNELTLLWQSTLVPGGITGQNRLSASDPIYLLDDETILTFGMFAPPKAMSLEGYTKWTFVPPATDEYCVNAAIELDSMVLLATNKNFLHALDTTGNLLWTTKLPGSKDWYCSVVIGDDDRIYAFADRGIAYCLDLDGNIIWRADVSDLRATSTPIIGPKGIIYGKTSQLEMVAISRDGTELRRSPPGSTGNDRFMVTEAGIVICPRLIRDVINAIDDQGNLLWTYNCSPGNSFHGEPAYSADGTTYVFETNPQAGNRLIAIDETGQLLWSYPCDLGFEQLAVLEDGRIVIVETCPAMAAIGNQFTMIALSIFGSKNGRVTILDPQGNVEATTKLPAYFSLVPPVELAGDKLLVLGVDGELYCYSTKF